MKISKRIKLVIIALMIILIVILGIISAYYQKQKENEELSDGLYESWKENYVVSVDDEKSRVIDLDQDNVTVSEGIGYGMLFSVMNNDRELFDKLFAYAKEYANENGFMDWKISSSGEVIGSGAATDAEEDIAYSLYLAYEKWDEELYFTEAENYIDNIMTYMVNDENILLPGDDWGDGTTEFNPSYVAPEYYVVFYEITGDETWLEILKENVEYVIECSDEETGLVPNWVNFDIEDADIFGYESIRIPIRLYQFIKNESEHDVDGINEVYDEVKELMNKQSDFAESCTYSDFKSEYYLDGTAGSEFQNNAYLASGLAMLLADEKESKEWYELLLERLDESYYGDSLRLWVISLKDDLDLNE